MTSAQNPYFSCQLILALGKNKRYTRRKFWKSENYCARFDILHGKEQLNMSSKYKATGCARFFLVLIILAPLAYLGASYYNGEDGIQNVKDLLGLGTSQSDNDPATYTETEKNEDKVEDKAEEASADSSEQETKPVENTAEKSSDQEKRIDELTKENMELKKDHAEFLKRIKALEDEAEALKTKQDTTG
jgi:uncharacterized protein YeeX (DUF496 family)